MKEDDKDYLKKGLEQPSSDFSKNIMQKIEAEEVAMRSVLSQHSLEAPSTSFTDSIMTSIEVKKLTPYKPVISKYVWYGLAAIFVGFVVFIISNTTVTGPSKIGSRLDDISKTFRSIFTGSSYLVYSTMAILGICLLLLLEQRLRKHSIS